MNNHTRIHHFVCCYPRFFGTALKHSKCHRHHELSIKIQLKEWTTALLLKHLLVSWDLWTYCIGFKVVGINIIIIIIVIKSPYCVSRECWAHSVSSGDARRSDDSILVSMLLTYNISSNSNNKTTIIYYS